MIARFTLSTLLIPFGATLLLLPARLAAAQADCRIPKDRLLFPNNKAYELWVSGIACSEWNNTPPAEPDRIILRNFNFIFASAAGPDGELDKSEETEADTFLATKMEESDFKEISEVQQFNSNMWSKAWLGIAAHVLPNITSKDEIGEAFGRLNAELGAMKAPRLPEEVVDLQLLTYKQGIYFNRMIEAKETLKKDENAKAVITSRVDSLLSKAAEVFKGWGESPVTAHGKNTLVKFCLIVLFNTVGDQAVCDMAGEHSENFSGPLKSMLLTNKGVSCRAVSGGE